MLQHQKCKIVDATLCFQQTGVLSFPLLLLCLTACLFRPKERLLFGFGLLILNGSAVAITDGMLYKIAPFLIWFHSFSILVSKVQVPFLQRCFAGKTNKNPITTVRNGFTYLIARRTAANLFTGPHRKNLLDGGLKVAGFDSSVCHLAKTSAQ